MTESGAVDRHASWLELFFDLVVVVAVAQLAHLLHGDAHHGPGGMDIITFFTLYLAIWLVWTAFTLYSNVVADRVRVRAMFLGMAGIATMAAAVPHSMDGRANLFAAAYLITTAIGVNAFQRSGMVLLTWTAASQNAGLVPWVVSFWVGNPWWKLGLWLFGIALTMFASVLMSRGDHEEMLTRLNERLAKRAERQPRGSKEPGWTALVAARLDAGHLGERFGLFVIIVLGEAMLQLVGAVAAIEDWRPGGGEGWLLLLTVVSAFLLLITLWGLNVRHAFAEETHFPPALLLPAHFVVIASITTVAAGLGAAAAGSADHLNPSSTWLMCGGVSAFLLVVNLLVTHTRLWPVRAVAVLLPLVVAVVAPWLPAAVIVTVLAVAAGGQLMSLFAVSRSDK
ncbi:low temperature requirement protein A [Actinocrispum wychmicini]|uniref:Low temperature requirement protein LtrA n=1 Tax=Actinocrispum wychmicini TaxID=1213861 RepID=A0A4R2JJJ0_9PSEU|nr:low temperature requirement protein A [Actinocrispum wychmicini]TCO54335.1 low temperature requirement protein LtrA [Actinocrispum wychmicini]